MSGAVLDSRVKDISNSPAYTFLDGLLRAGKLSQAQVDFYKLKYQKLHEVLISTYQNEKMLLDKAKELKAALETEKHKLEQRTILSHDAQSEIEQLQKEEKEYLSRVSLATDERNGIGFELDELLATKKEQREALQEKYNKSVAALDPLIHSLHTKIDELKAEIEKQQEVYSKELAASAEYEEKIESSHKAIAALEKEKLKKRAAYQTAMGEPERLKTNITLVESVAKDLEEESEKLLVEITAREAELATHQERRRATNGEIEELGVKLENLRLALAKRRSNLDDFKRAHEIEQQKQELTLERISVAEATKLEAREAARTYQSTANEYHKALEQQKKLYEKLRRKKDTIASIHAPLLDQIRESDRTLMDMGYQHRQQASMLAEIKQDEELFIAQYLNQEKLEEETTDVLHQVQAEQKEYEQKIALLAKEERELHQSIASLSAQRELMAREASKATSSYRETKEELKVKNLILLDLDKQTVDSFTKLKTCSGKYEKMKNQRNKLANLTQSSAQALAEMKEKIKILHNEVEILRAESVAKDKASAEETRLHLAAQNTRDALRVQQNKYINDLRVKREEESAQMLEIIKLNTIIHSAEAQMASLRRDYATAVDNRNRTGIQLIDRNDELCILYEKHNIQANILSSGDGQLFDLEESIKVVQRDLMETKRRVEVARTKIPSLDTYAATMKRLQQVEAELEKERERAAVLCEKLESPQAPQSKEGPQSLATQAQAMPGLLRSGDPAPSSTSLTATGSPSSPTASSSSLDATHQGRSRILKGLDPEPEQLAAKIEVLEERLNAKKEQLLEKELVLDEVSSLSNKLRVQAAETRGSTLDLAKKVNEVRGKVRHLTRKMMATVSELSMYQANAIKLEQEKGQTEKVLALARERMEVGQPPTDDAEHEWVKLERDRARQQEALLAGQMRAQQEVEEAEMALVGRSTAEPRPNAYIPEELAIPKPYGALAPFKPSQLGANSRHIRAPKPQEIQL